MSANPEIDALINEAVHSLAAGFGRMGAPMLGQQIVLADGRTGVVDGIGLGYTRLDGSHHDGWTVDLVTDGVRRKVELDAAQADQLFSQFEPDQA